MPRPAEVDVATGAYTRTRFLDELGRAVSEAQKQSLPLSLVHLDLDDLLEANDLHGREAIDFALAAVVSEVAEVVDGQGAIGRLGGDEFAVLLRGKSLEEAVDIAERIRARVGQEHHHSEHGSFQLTVSVGIASHRFGEPFGNLLDAAEQACLKAKQGGRDATVAR